MTPSPTATNAFGIATSCAPDSPASGASHAPSAHAYRPSEHCDLARAIWLTLLVRGREGKEPTPMTDKSLQAAKVQAAKLAPLRLKFSRSADFGDI